MCVKYVFIEKGKRKRSRIGSLRFSVRMESLRCPMGNTVPLSSISAYYLYIFPLVSVILLYASLYL